MRAAPLTGNRSGNAAASPGRSESNITLLPIAEEIEALPCFGRRTRPSQDAKGWSEGRKIVSMMSERIINEYIAEQERWKIDISPR